MTSDSFLVFQMTVRRPISWCYVSELSELQKKNRGQGLCPRPLVMNLSQKPTSLHLSERMCLSHAELSRCHSRRVSPGNVDSRESARSSSDTHSRWMIPCIVWMNQNEPSVAFGGWPGAVSSGWTRTTVTHGPDETLSSG